MLKIYGTISAICTIAAATTLLLAPATSAQAQPGSRLCGWTAPTSDGGYKGLLIEIHQDNSDANKDCSDTTDFLKYYYIDRSVTGNAALTWTKQKMNTCENVGKLFMSSNSPKDMCDKMEAYGNYSIIFDKSGNVTTYNKLN